MVQWAILGPPRIVREKRWFPYINPSKTPHFCQKSEDLCTSHPHGPKVHTPHAPICTVKKAYSYINARDFLQKVQKSEENVQVQLATILRAKQCSSYINPRKISQNSQKSEEIYQKVKKL